MPIVKGRSQRLKKLLKASIWGLAISVGVFGCATTDAPAPKDEIAYLRLTDGYWQAWVTDAQGSSHRQLTFGPMDLTRVTWSSKAGSLLGNQNDGELVVITLDGKSRPLNLPVSGMLDAAWSADGGRIAFSLNSTQRLDNNDLWLIDTDGANATKLTNQPGVVQSPTWHESGKTLIYSLSTTQLFVDLWKIDDAGRTKEQLTVSGIRHFNPTYSPQGGFLYSADNQGNFDIWLRDAQDNVTRITSHPAYDAEPSGSPDGEHIVFYSLRGGAKRIWVTETATGDTVPITPEGIQARYPIWLN